MKAIIKNNIVLAKHSDEQIIFYPGCTVKLLPNDFKRTVAIQRKFKGKTFDSFDVAPGDPDPFLDLDQTTADTYNKRQIDLEANIPSWSAVASAVDNISNLAEAKIVLKKLARIVYWLAKNQAN